MAITVEAVFENGVLKPKQPLPLKENETVRVTVQPQTSSLLAAYGIMRFEGSAADGEYFAKSPELDPQEE